MEQLKKAMPSIKIVNEEIMPLLAKSSFFDPPMCTELLRPYILEKEVLGRMDLKQQFVKYLMPFAFVLPTTYISYYLFSLLVNCLKKGQIFGQSISTKLKSELEKQLKYVRKNWMLDLCLSSFIISGGFVLKLLYKITGNCSRMFTR